MTPSPWQCATTLTMSRISVAASFSLYDPLATMLQQTRGRHVLPVRGAARLRTAAPTQAARRRVGAQQQHALAAAPTAAPLPAPCQRAPVKQLPSGAQVHHQVHRLTVLVRALEVRDVLVALWVASGVATGRVIPPCPCCGLALPACLPARPPVDTAARHAAAQPPGLPPPREPAPAHCLP